MDPRRPNLQVEISTKPAKGVKALVTQWLINAIALVLVSRFISGIELDATGTAGLFTVLGASAVLGLLNVLLKPFLLLVTLPITVLTLGLFMLVVNAAVLLLTANLVRGLIIHGFWPAFWGALMISVVNLILGGLFKSFFFSLKTHKDE
jgi:putative membrane protein